MRVWLRDRGRIGLVFALAALMSLALVAVACGDDDDDDADKTPTAAAATKTVTVAITATRVASPAGSPAAGGAAAATTVKVVMKDNSFDPKSINVPAGKEITFELDNQGQAIHDMSVKIDDKIPASANIRGGQKGTLKLTFAKAGTYDFMCGFHPAEMTGKITAQ